MTNEELALAIQAGDQSKVQELWEQTKKLLYSLVNRRYAVLELSGDTASVDREDLQQAAFLALVEAIKYYDPEKGYQFTAYLTAACKTEFNEAIYGGVTRKTMCDPAHSAISANTPIFEDENAATIEDMIADERDGIADAEERIFAQERHECIEKVLSSLPDEPKQAIRYMFYEGLNQRETAEKMNVNRDRIRVLMNKARQHFLRKQYRDELEEYVDFRTNFFLGASAERQESAVERIVIEREKIREITFKDDYIDITGIEPCTREATMLKHAVAMA